ncbi:MAG: hypothetical protein PG981_000382 [Wolbachia endosymbiont of Ctenocephalides orientis wCori]|nr:MAG: hypothetical protein PG981_000382 [Wolbachia endosymbiont of Ctenocephalides orientis wCori]
MGVSIAHLIKLLSLLGVDELKVDSIDVIKLDEWLKNSSKVGNHIELVI